MLDGIPVARRTYEDHWLTLRGSPRRVYEVDVSPMTKNPMPGDLYNNGRNFWLMTPHVKPIHAGFILAQIVDAWKDWFGDATDVEWGRLSRFGDNLQDRIEAGLGRIVTIFLYCSATTEKSKKFMVSPMSESFNQVYANLYGYTVMVIIHARTVDVHKNYWLGQQWQEFESDVYGRRDIDKYSRKVIEAGLRDYNHLLGSSEAHSDFLIKMDYFLKEKLPIYPEGTNMPRAILLTPMSDRGRAKMVRNRYCSIEHEFDFPYGHFTSVTVYFFRHWTPQLKEKFETY